MIDHVYFRQAELLLRVLPLVDREAVFALKGGTAINFFVRDFPRVSVDIDLVYLPIGERDFVPSRDQRRPGPDLPGCGEPDSRDEDYSQEDQRDRSLERMLGSARGCDDQDRAESGHARLALSAGTQDPVPEGPGVFELSVECRTLSEKELYAGKICAALDRQHPRDLFDVLMLFREGTFNDAMRKAFIVYLISHDRPMVELLDPGFADIRPVFETEFRDMTSEEVTCEDLEKTREQLVSMIARELTIQERQFIVSVKERMPQWDLIGLEGVQNLPAVQWKLLNIGRMAPAKHQQALRKLRDYLDV